MTNYNEFGKTYQQSAEEPFRKYPEVEGMLAAAGNVVGETVLDVACGDGHYARHWKHAGAGETVGVDLSELMIELARQAEAAEPLSIRYFVSDALHLTELCQREQLGPFDLVSASWLLVYATDRTMLDRMCQGLFAATNPDGRFIGTHGHYEILANHNHVLNSYNIKVDLHEVTDQWLRCTYHFKIGDEPEMLIDNTIWTDDLIVQAMEQAGFTDVSMTTAEVSQTAIADCGQDFWQPYIDHPFVQIIKATRPVE